MTSLPAFPASAALALSLSLSLSLSSARASAADAVARPPAAWLASWTASPPAVWCSDFVLPANVPDVLHGQTVRQVARLSVGGPRVRIVLSNAYGKVPLRIGAATVALAASASAIDVRFDASERLLVLRAGEILVTTAHDPDPARRPLRVQGRHGTVQALGTRFTLRQD